jgi:hypothetical protein
MKKILFFSIIALGAVMVSCNKPAQATEEKAEITTPASQELDAIRTAHELAKYGYEVESASALIEAANILASVPTQALEAEKEIGAQTENEVAKTSEKSLCPKELLAAAKEFANEDEVLLGMIAKVETKLAAQAEGTRGAKGGPKYDSDRVLAHDYVYYNIVFYANEIAEVAVSGDGDTDLDLYVYDANGNLITSDTDYTDDCYVRWVPAWTGTFKIKIVNRGGVYNNYVLVTN